MNRFFIQILTLILSTTGFAKQDVFQNQLQLKLDDENAAYVFDVPKTVYKSIYYSNLSDIRILNASGDYVPMRVVLNSDDIQHKYIETSLPTFKLNKVVSTPINTKQTRTTKSGNYEDYTVKTSKSMRYFLETQETQDNNVIYIDASVLKSQKIESLTLDWQFKNQGNRIFHVKLSGSNDLSNWHTIKSHQKLVEIKSGAKTILENEIKLNQSAYLFYQLMFDSKIIPKIKSIKAHLIAQFSRHKNNWDSPDNITLVKDNEIIFDTVGFYPIESFKINFKQKNTITDVNIYSRNKQKNKWRFAGSGSIYSIMTDGILSSKDNINIRRSNHRYWKIVLDKNIKNHSIKTIKYAWRNHQIEFLAQGNAPFTMVYGNKSQSHPAATNWHTKLPKSVEFSHQITINKEKPQNNIVIDNQTTKPKSDNAKILFWLILAFVILLLSFMAYKLVVETK